MTTERFVLDTSILTLLSDLNIAASTVLRRAHLPAGLFHGGPVSLYPNEYFRFWEALEEESQDPDLPVTIGRAISVEMFSPSIFAALCSPNLNIAAHRIAEYKPLIGPLRIAVASSPKETIISYHWPANLNPPQLLAMTELVFWVALARIATRSHVRPSRVTVPHMPDDPLAINEYFGQAVVIGPTHSVTFSMGDANLPFLTENEPMWRFFAPELRLRLSELHSEASTAERVRAALVETLPSGENTMNAIAHHLATSPRTLQRQLQSEGTTFQHVLSETREQLARHYLTQGSLTNAEIAYLLAYDDTNSFYRAFRSWTGTTPESAKHSLQQGNLGFS
jgi:AraC-like DNA-binding protein